MGPSGCSTAGTAKPAAGMHDEWQSVERHYPVRWAIGLCDASRPAHRAPSRAAPVASACR